MAKLAVTVSLVPEARGGPFVFWDDLAGACAQAQSLGFDAVEIFAPSPEVLGEVKVGELLAAHKLKLAAAGTGAGWVRRKLALVHADAGHRRDAREFIRAMIDAAAKWGAPAIIGSMQGRFGDGISRDQALDQLAQALDDLGSHAERAGQRLLFEPINRYESNLICTVEDGLQLLARLKTGNVRLLCDLFHMNIEEVDIAESLRRAGPALGHVHFVDSNRRAAGLGHMNYQPIADALSEIRFSGYLSAEVLPYPDPASAARQTVATCRKWFPTTA